MNNESIFIIIDESGLPSAELKKYFNAHKLSYEFFKNPLDAFMKMKRFEGNCICLVPQKNTFLDGSEFAVKISEEKLFCKVCLYLYSSTDLMEDDVIQFKTLGYMDIFKKADLAIKVAEVAKKFGNKRIDCDKAA